MKVFGIFNPAAGSLWRAPRISEIESVLKAAGISCVIWPTKGADDVGRLAREALRNGCTHLLVFGGDGTIREAANALVGSDVILVPVPRGTANLLSHELGLDSDWRKIPEHLQRGCVRKIDMGVARGPFVGAGMTQHFVLMAGMGADAVAVRGVDPRIKRWLGWGLYILSGFWNVVRHRPFHATLHFLDPPVAPVIVRAWAIVIGNARAYGIKGIRVTSRARIDDGLLDICVFQSASLLHFIGHFFKVLVGRHLEDEQVHYFQARSLRIETAEKIPVQLDGDLVGESPLELSVAPGVIRILVPSHDNPSGMSSA